MANVLAEYDVKLASNQVEYSLLRLNPETSGLVEEMKKRDIALLACESGHISDVRSAPNQEAKTQTRH